MRIIKNISCNAVNIPGWRTKRKLVVFESDDWGSIRMPSKDIFDQFIREGIDVTKDPYCRYDSLATPDDLECLFEVLSSVKDKNGRNVVFTADTVVANPDFIKIKDSGFESYFYEPFTETLKRSDVHNKSFLLWKEGISAGVFHPQFHGREHLNVKKWLNVLKKGGDNITRRAFELGTFGLTSNVDACIEGNYMGAFDSAEDADIRYYEKLLEEGLDLFEELFGYRSKSFIATTYTWSSKIEPKLKSLGIDYLQGTLVQKEPLDNGCNFRYKRTNFQGKKNNNDQYYLMRNCFFEPSQNTYIDWVDNCLYRISTAFRWGKAAVISSHRLNFIGYIDGKNRDKNLFLFRKLLVEIIKRWPDVEFMSSDELGEYINQCNNEKSSFNCSE